MSEDSIEKKFRMKLFLKNLYRKDLGFGSATKCNGSLAPLQEDKYISEGGGGDDSW